MLATIVVPVQVATYSVTGFAQVVNPHNALHYRRVVSMVNVAKPPTDEVQVVQMLYPHVKHLARAAGLDVSLHHGWRVAYHNKAAMVMVFEFDYETGNSNVPAV